jgi:multidrug efflux pump subunit AcrB
MADVQIFGDRRYATRVHVNVVVKLATEGHQVNLGDVARIELRASDQRRITQFNGQPAIAVRIITQATANPLLHPPPGVTWQIAIGHCSTA